MLWLLLLLFDLKCDCFPLLLLVAFECEGRCTFFEREEEKEEERSDEEGEEEGEERRDWSADLNLLSIVCSTSSLIVFSLSLLTASCAASIRASSSALACAALRVAPVCLERMAM